ncbi:50S ribosomal protein L21 [Bythopirellula polymerisocia]|uniref:Large ribosomal subunit protein bL21 n=1 Tax=Bythopirellula polymerisocia TaxID=2528003 RepID=A0A5C6CY66_9BACT|nr:50S ribosomal protein L21 [Bythopirellula polymerisocia]TWU29510.1 50S ribosomal protein L21 [Bythopirellula polymerisocia]
MYAIILDGGRQFKVEEGQELTIDYRDLPAGDKLTFEKVLAISNGSGDLQLGAPTVAGATVTAEVLGADKGEKLVVQKFRRRKNSRRKTGHRSLLTRVKIAKISG